MRDLDEVIESLITSIEDWKEAKTAIGRYGDDVPYDEFYTATSEYRSKKEDAEYAIRKAIKQLIIG